MDIIHTNELLAFSQAELLHSEEIIEKFGGNRCAADDYYMDVVIGKSYNQSDHSLTYRKLKHLECTFENILFDGTDGASSIVIDCSIKGCKINNAGFRTSDFSQTKFLSSADADTFMINSSFNNSNFTASKFKQTHMEGCSFICSSFKDTSFIDCSLNCCDFEASVFENTTMKNLDMTTVGIDFTEFIDVDLQNVTFSCWGILWSFGGLNTIKKFENEVYLRLPNNDNSIVASEFLDSLPDLQAHFYYKKDFLSLANINIFLGNQEKAFLYIKEGLLYNLYIKNFKMIKFLCKLASYNYFFSKKQLSQLYYALQSDTIVHSMTTYEYNNYFYEMNEIKKLLIDNPFNLPQISIKIITDINNSEKDILTTLLSYLDQVIESNAPQSIYSITIRHNSPISLDILDSDTLQNLYQIGIYLIISFWGLIPQINSLLESFTFIKQLCTKEAELNKKIKEQELEIKKEELKNQKLNNELMLLEKEKKIVELHNQILSNELLEKQKSESKQEEISNQIENTDVCYSENNKVDISPEMSKRILKISLSINTNETIPSELREISIENPQ